MTATPEQIRRNMVQEINANPGSREALEAKHGQVWDTSELQRDFVALGFSAPFIVVRKKDTGEKGSLDFQHDPRFYYGWKPE